MNPTNLLQFHHDSLIIDGLSASNFFDLREIERLHDAGLTAVNIATYSSRSQPPGTTWTSRVGKRY